MHALKPSCNIEIIWLFLGIGHSEYAEYWCYAKWETADYECFKTALMC